MCRFGTPWKMGMRIATNTALGGLRMWCACTTKHIQLRGGCAARRKPCTVVAQPYPRGLCRLVAAAQSLDIARCAKCSNQRIGEAANPGPRVVSRSHDFSLETVNTLSVTTLALEASHFFAMGAKTCARFEYHGDFQLSANCPCSMPASIW